MTALSSCPLPEHLINKLKKTPDKHFSYSLTIPQAADYDIKSYHKNKDTAKSTTEKLRVTKKLSSEK